MNTGRANRGFTIIEIIVAVAILGMIMTAVFTVWETMLRASRVGNAAADRVQRERVARESIRRALDSVQVFGANQRHYGFVADTENDRFAFLSFVSHLPEDFPGGGMFPDQPVRRVSFEVQEDGSNGLPQLLMRQELILSDHERVDESYPMTLITNLGLFNVEFWNTNDTEWMAEWADTNALPPMMRLIVGYDGEDEKDLHVSVVRINGSPVPSELQVRAQRAPGRPSGEGVSQR
jgi:prepilin-type N-terminal cleavage/methylation domain-containing protein